MAKKKTEEITPAKIKKKIGRPSKYTKELGVEICKALAYSIHGIRRICRENEHFPHYDTIQDWRDSKQDFSDFYEAAKLKQALRFAEDIVEIADELVDPFIITDKGTIPNPHAVAHARLRMDARKWIACKLLPKVYGDKMQQEVTLVKHEDTIEALK